MSGLKYSVLSTEYTKRSVTPLLRLHTSTGYEP
jgi:hypothetical protein